MALEFDMPEEQSSIIKVIGVGGGGSNAVTYMFEQGIRGVNFIICNTDAQALEKSPVPNKIQLGPELTSGRGAGSLPEIGRDATLESAEEIKHLLSQNTKMVFVTAGMGGGTGTGGAPIVAKIARELGILTVGIVTQPFDFEGKRKRVKAEEGISELKNNVDALIVISNNKLRDIYGNLILSEAFGNADSILTTAAKGISEIITKAGIINVDFEDVKTVMKESGVALMGTGLASGENRALKAVDAAMTSPLLNNDDICGAKGILLNITSGSEEVKMDEVTQITEYVQQAAANDTEIIWGVCQDESLEDQIMVTLIATGFDDNLLRKDEKPKQDIIVHTLDPTKSSPKEVEAKPVVKEEITAVKDDADEEEKEDYDAINEEFFQEETPKEDMQVHLESQYTIEFTDLEQAPHQQVKRQETESEFDRLHRERMKKLKSIVSLNKLSNGKNLRDLENEPAYVRRNIEIKEQAHSSEPSMSRYSMDDSYNPDMEESFELKDNPFLHDNVD